LHHEDILLLLVLFILWKIFCLAAKMSPTNPNVLVYDRELLFTWLLNTL